MISEHSDHAAVLYKTVLRKDEQQQKHFAFQQKSYDYTTNGIVSISTSF